MSAATKMPPGTDTAVLADLAHAAIGAFGWDTREWPSGAKRHAWCLQALREWSFPDGAARQLVGADTYADAWATWLREEADACREAIDRAWSRLDEDERRRATEALGGFGWEAPTEEPPTPAWDVDRDAKGEPR